jgi:hypothetical protein
MTHHMVVDHGLALSRVLFAWVSLYFVSVMATVWSGRKGGAKPATDRSRSAQSGSGLMLAEPGCTKLFDGR